MVKFNFWIWCADCKVYMDLGTYDFDGGHFDGPLIPMENRRVGSDWALRRFLEQHVGHRIGLETDAGFGSNTSPIKSDWKELYPPTAYCMVFEEMEKLLNHLKFPKRIGSALFIVDVHGWAWDIASRELLNHWIEIEGKIVSVQEFLRGNVDPADYDAVFVYSWGLKRLMDRLSPWNTIVCIAGGDQLDLVNTFKYNCGRFKFFAPLNDALKTTIEQWHPSATTAILSHGVETDLFKPRPIPHEGFVVGWVGSTKRPLKRFLLAREIAKVAAVPLSVAGFTKEDTYRLHEEMPFFYNACDVLLVTSNAEAHPMIVYEAMSCGIPVITTRVGDVDESIVDGVNGFILEINAPISEFVDRIDVLKNDEAFRIKMGEEARKTILRKWTWDKIVEQYRRLPKIMGVT